MIRAFHAFGVLLPIIICYDDACHLLARLLSLFGTRWEDEDQHS
jgi:hypothetical protein